MVTAALALALAVIGTAAPALARDNGGTERRTAAFISALEREDLATVSALLDPDATLTLPLSFSGRREDASRFTGKEQVLGYVKNAFALFGRIDLVNVKTSVSAAGTTSFVQADGDFTTADGRPYRNVYVYAFEWRAGRMVKGAEYANPVTFWATFPTTPGC
ncbi:nuclear transport factor 2 family protein [Nonomuraea sp. 10N515B]|uniref:nuclear transport factor 2 family protein n=1 Tax=Nonomuraea sp. 10N515B TaxID=3457422 RepID=UPI003FCC9760